MILTLYDKDHNKIRPLYDIKDYHIDSVLSTGDKTLSFIMPSSQLQDISNESYVRDKDEFVIKSITPASEGWYQIQCNLNVETLESYIEKFETVEKTMKECLDYAFVGTGWHVGVCEITKRRTLRRTNTTPWQILQDARKTYRAEIAINSIDKVIDIYSHIGADKGVYFSEQLNLKDLKKQSTSFNFYTQIVPKGKDDLTIESVNDGKNTLSDFSYSTKVKTFLWIDQRYTVAESLKEDAQYKLNEMSKPVIAYTVSVIDLAKMSDVYKDVLAFRLGDTVTLLHKSSNTSTKTRIVKTTVYPNEPNRNTCDVANSILTLEDIQQDLQDAADTVSNVTTNNGELDGSKVDGITTNQISDFSDKVGELTDLTAIKASITDLYATRATIQDLQVVNARIGTLETTSITTTIFNAELAKINQAIIGKADVTDLTSVNGKIGVLESNVGTINTLISGSVTAGSTQTIVLNAENTTIANALIKSAMIDSVTANKITAGIIDASSIHFKSKSGNMDLFDNTFLIKDATRERVQIGKDATGDYNIYVWDKTGKLMFDATGVTADGIQRPIIRNDMVSPNANIDGGKINIVSLVTEINNGTTKIESSHVLYDGKSLDVAFNSMETIVTDTSESLKTLSTQFAIEQGKVSTLITESSQTKQDLTEAKGNISTLRTDYSSLQQTVSGLNITVGQHTSSITKVQNDFDDLQIGSRNLIKKSSFNTFDRAYWTATSGSTITTGMTDPNGGKRALHLKAAQANTCILLARSSQVFPSVGVYSLSIWLRSNKTGKVDVTLNSSSAHPTGKYKTCDVTTIWQKFTLTCNVDDLSLLYDFVIGGYSSWTDLSFELDIAFPMLVASNKPSEWMPAPEDIETEIKTVSDKQVTFDASLNGFVGRVSSVESTTETLTNKTDTLTTEISSVSSKQASLELDLKKFKTEISETYVSGDTFNSYKSSITQTVSDINLEVSKKVNETSIISSINLSPEELKIHTSRLILEGDALNKCNNPAFTNGVSDDWHNLNGVYNYKDVSFAPCVYAGITKSDGTAAVYGEPFVVAQGTQYYLECDVNYLKVSTGFTIALLCYDKYLKNPSFVPVYQQSPIVGWGNVRGNVTIPINKRYAKIVCYSTVGAIHHFSNVIVKNKVGTDLIVDGAITASKVASNEFIAMLNNSTGGYAKLTGNSLEFYENSLAKKTTSLKKGRLNFYRGYDGALQSFFTDVQLGSNKLITGTALNSAKAPYFFDFGRDANMRDDESSYNAKVQLRIVFEDIPAGNGLTTSIPKGVHIYDAPLYAHNKIYCSSTLNMGNNAMFTHKSKFDCIFSKDDAMVIGFDDTPLHIGNIATRSETSATINTIVQVVSTPGVIVYGYLDMKQNTLWNAKFQGCTTVSDIKYKKNIEKLNDVAWLDEITINTYDYTNCDLKDQIGIIANDYVAKPYAKYFVATDKDGDLSVDYFALSNANIAYSQQNKRHIKDIEQCIVNSHQEFTKFKNECNRNINELTNKHQQELQNLRNEYNQKLLMMENKIEQLESRLN